MGRISGLIPLTVAICAGIALLISISACNEHAVQFGQTSGAVEEVIYEDLGGGDEIDILWMIDNSGSMCRSQRIVRESIDDFVAVLNDVNLDFHIGITTSHMLNCDDYTPDDDEYEAACVRETVANAGRLQATPQPMPGFDPACAHPVFAPGDPALEEAQQEDPDILPGDPNLERLDPVYENIDVAIECTQNPSEWQHLESQNVNEAALRCALPSRPLAENCDNYDMELEDFYPDPSAYRDIPVVLRAQDYADPDTGVVDLEAFGEDFACASLVGTRGYGIERGLDAVVTALSPELTGGPDSSIEDQHEFPNAGFIRSSAQTGVIFITDENDCSHDGNLDEQTTCGVHNCTIEENKGEDGHLTPIADLRSDFLLNLAGTRGTSIDFEDSENYNSLDDIDHLDDLDPEADSDIVQAFNALQSSVLPASLHGPYQKVNPSEIPQQCGSDRWEVPTACRTEMGRGWSGHRYEYFLREFPIFFPSVEDPDRPDDPLDGLICEDFSDALEEIAGLFASESTGCVDGTWACADNADCPVAPYDDDERDRCLDVPGSDGDAKFCDSAIEVRLIPPEDDDPTARLESTEYCIDGTFDDPAYPNTCVVDPSRYSWIACEGRTDALRLEWNDPEWHQLLGGFSTITRYVHMPDDVADSDDDDNGNDDDDDNGDD